MLSSSWVAQGGQFSALGDPLSMILPEDITTRQREALKFYDTSHPSKAKEKGFCTCLNDLV